TDRCHVLDDPWGDQAIAVRFEDPAGAAENIARACAGTLDGIVAVGDRPAWLAALAAERLGLPYNSPASVEAARSKYLSRECFQGAGLLTPGYARISLEAAPGVAAAQARYPCVLKPLGLSASRGVIRADDSVQFRIAFERIRALLDTPGIVRLRDRQDRHLQVEDFIEGREFALEGLLSEGRLRVLAVFDKPDPLDGPYFEETIYTTPSRESAATQRAMVATAERAVAALGLTRGPVHTEMRVNSRGVWMLEVAARPIGGLCAKTLRFAPSVSLEEVILRHAAGLDIGQLIPVRPASGVMMIPIPRDGVYQGVSGTEPAAAVPGIEDVIITAKQGQNLARLPEGASYLGFLFARGDTPAKVERALRAAHVQLQFQIAMALPVAGMAPPRAGPD
ncbi:MAG: ATP-grasp domain-containing protein, partial [Pseudomonadota bacterium]